MTELKLWHDSDGCLADFDGHARNLLGAHPNTVGDSRFWEIANAEPRFWKEMKLIPGALDYWNKIKHLDPTILTGAPKGEPFENAKADKEGWWLKEFLHANVIVCLSKNKWTYIQSEKDVLVDDTYRIVKKWRESGGTAILHKNFADTLSQLKDIGFDIH